MLKTENERIRAIREALGIDQGNFAQAIGLEQGSLSDIERGKVKKISPVIRQILFLKFNVNIDYLKTGKGKMFNEKKKEEYNTNTTVHHVSESETIYETTSLNINQQSLDKLIEGFNVAIKSANGNNEYLKNKYDQAMLIITKLTDRNNLNSSKVA